MSKYIEQMNLFDVDEYRESNRWEDEWKNMPEYDNTDQPAPMIIAVFKFSSEEDFLKFNGLITKSLFAGKKPFDGMQRKNRKTTWYPHKEKFSNYRYIDEPTI